MAIRSFSLLTLLIFVGLVFLPICSQAQDADTRRPMVRLIYFLPSDRAPQPDINEKMDTLIKDVQALFANQMEAHGFDRKTFLYETDARGKAVVHQVIGRFTDEYYNNLPYTGVMWSEIDDDERFDTSKNFYLTAIDISGEILDTGIACGRGGGWNDTGGALVPASGHCFSVSLIAHELGHAFGLHHGFYGRDIDNKQIWLYSDDSMLNTFWTADWFDVHVAFNPSRASVLNTASEPTVKMLPPSLAAPPNEIRLRFEITGANGQLHQAQLIKPPDSNNEYPLFLAGQRLTATPDSTVEFVTVGLTSEDRHVFIQMIDRHGNMTRTRDFPIDVTPLLPSVSDFYSPTSTIGRGNVSDIAYSPDGQHFAVAGGIGISLYDAETNASLNLLSHTANIRCIAFSPDGQLLAGGDSRGTTLLWDVGTGKIRHTLTGKTYVLDVAFSPDGQLLAIAGSDGSIRLWDVHMGKIHHTLKHRAKNVNSVAFSPDGKTLASGGTENIVYLWDIGTGEIRDTLIGHQGWIQSVAFSPDGQVLASAALEGTIRLWDVRTGVIRDTLTGHRGWVQSVAFSPDGQVLASGGTDHFVRLWDVGTTNIRDRFTGHRISVDSVAFSPNGKTLASLSSQDSNICLWDVHTGESHHTFKEHSGSISTVRFSPDGQTLASQEKDNIRLWDAGTRKIRHTFTGTGGPLGGSFAISPDSQTLASEVWRDDSIHLWDVNTGEILHTLPIEDDESVRGVMFSPNGQTLVSASWSDRSHKGSIRFWNVRTGKIRETLLIEGFLNNGVFSPDGRMLAAGIANGSIHLWDVRTGKIRKTLTGHNDSVSSMAFSPDGNTLASASSDTTIRLWNVRIGKNRQSPIRHRSAVRSVAFSPNRQTLVSASSDTVFLWDARTGKHRKTLATYDIIRSLSFSPDSQTLAGGGFQGTVQFWEASSDLPLPVSLSSFKAKHTTAGIVVNWTTKSEIDNAGFNILRSRTHAGNFKQVNGQLIAGAGTTAERNTYTWTDTTAKPNTVYYYRIEDVSYAGERKQLATVRLRGLVSATNKRITLWSDLKRN